MALWGSSRRKGVYAVGTRVNHKLFYKNLKALRIQKFKIVSLKGVSPEYMTDGYCSLYEVCVKINLTAGRSLFYKGKLTS